MPLYEYRCTICQHVFEVHHEVGGAPGPCPVCGGEVRRLFTSVGLVFKGSGFHSTDYPRPASRDSKDAPSGKEAPSEGDKGTPSGKEAPSEGGKGTEATPKGT